MAGRKLKVFEAQFGFYDTVVAAPSQAVAQRAWGARHLFASGDAKLGTDMAAVAAALDHPDTPLRRAVGCTDPFQLDPVGLPEIPAAPKSARPKAAIKSKPDAPAKLPPDRAGLHKAEAALQKLDAARKREEAGFRRRREALNQAEAPAQNVYVQARKAAVAAIVQARKAYRSADGED